MKTEAMFRPIVKAWAEKLKLAFDYKKREFGDDAAEAIRFFDGPYDWMYGPMSQKGGSFAMSSDDGSPQPTFRMTLNKVAEVVQLYGPALYHRNPHREMNVRKHSDYPFDLEMPPAEVLQTPQGMMQAQMLQQKAQQMEQDLKVKQLSVDLMAEVVNFTPNEMDLRFHSRQAVDEALIKGMGLLWHETYRPPGSPYKFFGSFYDSVDNLLVDPDMESLANAMWVAKKCIRPRWVVEKEYGLKKGTLKGDLSSARMQAETGGGEYDYFRARGDTNDLVVYWKIWSRMGMGHRLQKQFLSEVETNSKLFDQMGEYTYMVITDGYDHFLNAPEEAVKKESIDDIFMRFQWPTPFWADPTDPWPFSSCAFHERPRKVWPMSHVKPGLGQLKFMNWAMSFLADKVKNTSRDFLATLKSAGEEIRTAMLSGKDLTLLEFEKTQGDISKVVQFLQHPPMNKDILEVVNMLKGLFDQAVGLDELMYGSSGRQMRSSAEAQIKDAAQRIRPDDMSECVEAWQTKCARKEAIGSFWHLEANDVLPILGRDRAPYWDSVVKQRTLTEVTCEIDYRIEAGSIRKPNRERDIANANNALQVLAPIVQQYMGMTGDMDPINTIMEFWAKANDYPTVVKFTPPPPPKPDEAAMQQQQMEMEMKQQEHQQKLQQNAEAHQQKLGQEGEKTQLKSRLDAMGLQAKLEQEGEVHGQKLFQDDEVHDQELTQDQQKHLQDMLQAREKGNLDLILKKKLAEAAVQNRPAPNGNSSNN